MYIYIYIYIYIHIYTHDIHSQEYAKILPTPFE